MITDIKKRALHRSRIIQGQMKGLEKMIDDEKYCMDVLTQSLAIQRSLGSLSKLILENHLRTHIAAAFESGDEDRKAKALKELLDLYDIVQIKSK